MQLPRQRIRDEEALLVVVNHWRRFEWARFLLALCVLFHLWMAAAIAFAPDRQIITEGTARVFELAPRGFWAVCYLLAALGALALMVRVTAATQLLTWFTVFPLASTWVGAFTLAVLEGGGSAIGLIVWPAVYLPWAVVAIRLALGKR